MQSDRTLTTQIYFFLTIQQMDGDEIPLPLMSLGNNSTKRRKNQVEIK